MAGAAAELIARFSIADYVVFSLMLMISAAIGVYYACSGGKQKTNDEFLMANRSLRILPVAMSILASFMSAIALLGTPAEIYLNGGEYWMIMFAYTFMVFGSCFLYLPIFYRLRLTSVNEYLEMRFNKVVRIFGCLLFVVQMILYMAIVLYAPSLAFSQVTGIPVWGAVLSTGIVCTFYTTIGGMKAVVWTDAFQVIMMFLAIFTVIIKGCIDVGGIEVFFDPDPTTRHSIWAISIGGYVTWVVIYGVNQAMVQRALWLNYPMLLLMISTTSFAGLVLYAKYHLCDPISTKRVSSTDQIFPLFVMETLGEFPGIPVSSGVNSLSAVTIEDILKPYFLKSYSETTITKITKALALGYGVLCIILVAVAQQLGGILQAALSVFGMIGGPLLGVFTLGIFFPHANSKRPPISVAGCPELYLNVSGKYTMESFLELNKTIDDLLPASKNEEILYIYRLSYLWLSAIAVVVVLIVGLLVSFITGRQDPKKLNPMLISPVFDILCCCLPGPLSERLGCHVGDEFNETQILCDIEDMYGKNDERDL
ncbi:Sodium-coupled monocarboxylate transporter 1 [Nymphon striatum]|nr:Sodium-coupled monocarboxylate transporter 1 [Nymphon striatum]